MLNKLLVLKQFCIEVVFFVISQIWDIFVLVHHTVSHVIKTEEDMEEMKHFLKTLVGNLDFLTNYSL